MKYLKLMLKTILLFCFIGIFGMIMSIVGFTIYGSYLDEQKNNNLREMKFKQDSILIELHLKTLNVCDTLVIINSQSK